MRIAALLFAGLAAAICLSPSSAYAQTAAPRWNAAFTHYSGSRAVSDFGGILQFTTHPDGTVTGSYVNDHSRPSSLMGHTTARVTGHKNGLRLTLTLAGPGLHAPLHVTATYTTDRQLHGAAKVSNVPYVFTANEL
jgi:hypothetical protein